MRENIPQSSPGEDAGKNLPDIEMVTSGRRKTEEEIEKARQFREELNETRERIQRREDAEREIEKVIQKQKDGGLLSAYEAALLKTSGAKLNRTEETQKVSDTTTFERSSEKTDEEIRHEQRVRAGIVGRAAQLGQAENVVEEDGKEWWKFNDEFIEKARGMMRKELEEARQGGDQPTAGQSEDTRPEGQTETIQPPSPEAPEAPPVPEAHVEKTTEDFLRELEEARREYVGADRAYKASQKESGVLGINKGNLEGAKYKYERISSQYAREHYLEEVEKLKIKHQIGIEGQENVPEFDREVALLKADLFEGFFSREQDALAKARVEQLESRKRSWFEKMVISYMRKPLYLKLAIPLMLVPTAMVAGGAGIGAAAAYGGYRFVRGMVGAKLAVLVGGLVKGIRTAKAEAYGQKRRGELRANFGINIEDEIEKVKKDEGEDVFQRWYADRCQEYEKMVKEVNKMHRDATRWGMAAGVAVGGVTAYGLAETNLDGPLGNWLSQKFGFVDVRPPEVPLPDVRVPDEVPVPDEALERLHQAAHEAHVPEARVPEAEPPELIKTPMPDEAPITPEVQPVVPPEEQIPVAPAEEITRPAVENVVEVQEGDSVWKLAERQLEARGYFDNLTGTPEEISAQRIYLIDSIKDKVVENPSAFGISSGDAYLLRVGEQIDFSSVFESNEIQRSIGNVIERAQLLSEQGTPNIPENNEGIPESNEVTRTGEVTEAQPLSEQPPLEGPPSEQPSQEQQKEPSQVFSQEGDYFEKMRSVATIQPPYPVRYWTGQSFEDYFTSATQEWGGKALYVPDRVGGSPQVSDPEMLSRLMGWFKERGDVVSERFVNYEKVALVIVPQPEDSQFEIMKVISTDERTPWTQSRLVPKDVLYGDGGARLVESDIPTRPEVTANAGEASQQESVAQKVTPEIESKPDAVTIPEADANLPPEPESKIETVAALEVPTEITRDVIVERLRKEFETFGMFPGFYDQIRNMDAEIFIDHGSPAERATAETVYAPGERLVTGIFPSPRDKFVFDQIEELQKRMQSVYKDIPLAEAELAGKLSVEEFIKKYFDRIFTP